jgi:hypothetical protein
MDALKSANLEGSEISTGILPVKPSLKAKGFFL